MGYVNVKEMWYSVGEGSVLEGRLELLSDDKWACHMVNIAILNGQVHLFVVHMVSEPQIVHLLAYGGNEVAADEEVDVESSEGSSESDEDFDVHSWNESKEELYVAEGDDGLFDVPIGGDDASEDELFEVRIKEGNVGGVRGLSSQKPTPKHADQRGFSDTEWESETLDSDTSDEDRDRYGSFSIFCQPKNMEDYNWEVGTYFTEKEHFTDAIRTYRVHSGRKLKIFRNDKRRICVKCLGAKGKCKWYAYCAYKAAQSTWQLRKIINNHTCSREFNVRLMTSKWLSGRLEKTLRENPGVK